MRDEKVTHVLVYRQEIKHQECREHIVEAMEPGDSIRYRNSQGFRSQTDCEPCHKVIIYGDPENTRMVPTNPAKDVLLAYQKYAASEAWKAWAENHGAPKKLIIEVVEPPKPKAKAAKDDGDGDDGDGDDEKGGKGAKGKTPKGDKEPKGEK